MLFRSTGKENLKFFGKLYGLKGKKLESRVQYVAELVNLTYELDKKTSQYSGGMLQRLSLAVALIAEPEVLLLDEPTVGIDPLLRQDIWQELRNLANMGVTILITTHVMDEAEKCDSLAMMREGKILATGTAGELISLAKTDTIEEAFIYFSEEDTFFSLFTMPTESYTQIVADYIEDRKSVVGKECRSRWSPYH